MWELRAENAVEYARERGWIGPGPARAELLSGGVSNCVLRIEHDAGRLIVKQSRPQLRTTAPWFSDVARIYREEDAQRLLAAALPGWVPEVLFSDRANHAYAMEHAPADARTWKELLLAGEMDTTTARDAGLLLRTIHGVEVTPPERFADRTVFRQLRTEPFYDRVCERHPDLADAIRPLVEAMETARVGLCHGDFSPKNLLVSEESLLLVDHETAHLGEPAMDVGFFFSHLLLKAIRSPQWREPMFAVVRAALKAYGRSPTARRGLGHLGVCLLARVDATSPVDYLPRESQKDAVRRLGRKLLLDSPRDWETALAWADEEVRNQGP